MKRPAIFAAALLLFLGSSSLAKEWNGIFPLHSTRADVTTLFGGPYNTYGPYFSRYRFAQYSVVFEYSAKPCDDAQPPWGRYEVPAESVLTITILPSSQPTFSEYPINNRETLRRLAPDSNGFFDYLDSVEGISYSVKNNIINTVTYGPSAAENYLRCSDKSPPNKSLDRSHGKRLSHHHWSGEATR